jgi:hypothetical protein
MKAFLRWHIILISLLILATGCGGGSSTSNFTEPVATSTGVFIDAPVAGLSYVSGSHSGLTDNNGSFTYEVGKNVTFSVGGIVIGTAPAQKIMTPINFGPAGSDAATPETVARVQLLLSVSDNDPTTGGLTIPDQVRASAAGKSIDFSNATQTELANLVTSIVPSRTLVTPSDAQAHLTASIFFLFKGSYSGTWTGTTNRGENVSGTWSGSIDSSGYYEGTTSSPIPGNSPSPTEGFMLTKLSTGTQYVFSGSVNDGFGSVWSGTLDVVTKVFSGTWENSEAKGTYTGTLQSL